MLDFLLTPTTTRDHPTEVEHDDQNKGGKFKCTKCGFCYTNNQLLQSHISNEHSSDKSRFTCSFCPITFHTKKFMLIHKQNNHPEKCHKCHICHQIYFSLRKLSSHHSSKHAEHENVNALKCSFCGKGKVENIFFWFDQGFLASKIEFQRILIIRNNFWTWYIFSINRSVNRYVRLCKYARLSAILQ